MSAQAGDWIAIEHKSLISAIEKNCLSRRDLDYLWMANYGRRLSADLFEIVDMPGFRNHAFLLGWRSCQKA